MKVDQTPKDLEKPFFTKVIELFCCSLNLKGDGMVWIAEFFDILWLNYVQW
jgi:hypothetical protein